jgi:hypothetical protein
MRIYANQPVPDVNKIARGRVAYCHRVGEDRLHARVGRKRLALLDPDRRERPDDLRVERVARSYWMTSLISS